MKEATGELNMTLVTIIAVAAVLTFAVAFLPQILNGVGDKYNEANSADCWEENGKIVCSE